MPPGRTVVDVADLATLAHLAELHQGVILHRQDPAADLYLLEHDHTLYRLHAPRDGDPHRAAPHDQPAPADATAPDSDTP